MKEKVCTLSDIRRLYVRKKENFRQGEESLTAQLKEILGERIHETAIYHRYDVDHLSGDDYEKAVATVFSEPPVDSVQAELPKGDMVIAVEFLPGQYDQRADSAEQCLAIVTGRDGARVRCALVYVSMVILQTEIGKNFEISCKSCGIKRSISGRSGNPGSAG